MESSNTDSTWTSTAHQSSHRLTAGIILHVFVVSGFPELAWHPGDSFLMDLPPDIDLTGYQQSDQASRQLYFTPCNSPNHGVKSEQVIKFILRSGQLSSLISLPRFESLRARIRLVSSGIDFHAFNQNEPGGIEIAGGTGISPFLALHSSILYSGTSSSSRVLFWSLHVDDLALATYVLLQNYLPRELWQKITIFVTRGTSTITASTIKTKCQEFLSHLSLGSQNQIQFCCRRMTEQDIRLAQSTEQTSGAEQKTIYFCGSKSLQWQIKRWGAATAGRVLTIPIPERASQK